MAGGLHLQTLRARVERLARWHRTPCQADHDRLKVSFVIGEAKRPDWPAVDAPTQCQCGAPLRYRHIVHECDPTDAPNRTALEG